MVALGSVSVLAAQGAPTPACALLSVAEVRTITGTQNYPDFVDGDPDGEGAGGASVRAIVIAIAQAAVAKLQ